MARSQIPVAPRCPVGKPTAGKHGPTPRRPLRSLCKSTERQRKLEAAGIFDQRETRALLELTRGMLKFRPEDRLTIDEMLKSDLLVNWALPQLKDCRQESDRGGQATLEDTLLYNFKSRVMR